MNDVQQLSPQLQQEVGPLLERWRAFVGKFTARVEEAIAEADQGLDALIQQHATDHGPMGAAMGALKGRFNGLSQKLDQAQEKIDEELWEILFRDDISPRDGDVVSRIRDVFCREHEQIREGMDLQVAMLETSKNATWARRLQQLAQQEIQGGAPCSGCGAPFQVEVYWKSTNQKCPHCGAMSSVSPGPAASMFYQGIGIHSLAHEAAIEEWKAEQQAENRYNALRHPTEKDRQQYLASAQAYWTKYYQTVAQIDPGFDGNVEGAVQGRLQHYSFWDPGVDQQARAYMDRVIEMAAARNEGGLRQLMSGERPSGVWGLDDICEAIAERGDVEGTKLALAIRYDLEDEDDPKDEWVREQLREIMETVRSR